MLYIEKHVGILNQPMYRILEKFVAHQMLYIYMEKHGYKYSIIAIQDFL